MKGKRISDIQLAAWLVSEGHAILAVEGDSYKRVFVFDVTEEMVLQYYSAESRANPRMLFNAYRDVRALLTQLA